MKVKWLSRVQLFATPQTVACSAPLSVEFSRQEYWSELPFPFPGDLPNPGIESGSPELQAGSLLSEPPGKPTLIFSTINIVVQSLSCIQLFATLWTVAHQAPLSVGFSRQEYWSGLPCSPPGDLSNTGIESTSLRSSSS